MKMKCEHMPDRINVGGIRVQSQDWGMLNVSNIHFPPGADATPLLKGLPDDLCPMPHWGMVLQGAIKVKYADGSDETVEAGEVYHWPAGHTVSVNEACQAIEFSPAKEMGELIEHLKTGLGV